MDFSVNKQNIYFDDNYCFNVPGIRRAGNIRTIDLVNLSGHFSKKFTFSCWVKLTIFAGSFPALFYVGDNGSDFEFWLYWASAGVIRCRMTVNLGVSPNGRVDWGGNAALNNWHHVVLSVDQTNEIALYIDKVKFVAPHNESIRHENLIRSSRVVLLSGIDNNSFEPYGQMKDLYFFTEFAASQADVNLLYGNNLTNGNLHTRLKLNQKNGSILIDNSGNNNHATLNEYEKTDTLENGNIWKPII